MDRTEEYGTLAAFTALAPLAVGGLAGLAAATQFKPGPEIDRAAMLVLAIGVLALVISLLHLGRPWRAPLALRRVATSWLSREVLLFALFLLTLGCYAILPVLRPGDLTLYAVGIAGVIIGLLGTVATGETYRLHARPSWDQWLATASFPLGALSAGSLFGFFVARQFATRSEVPAYAWAAVEVLLALALVVSWMRSTRRLKSPEGRLSRQLALGASLWLLAVRAVGILGAMIMIWMGGEAQFLAWVPALLGEFADRLLFFRTVVPVTLRGRYL